MNLHGIVSRILDHAKGFLPSKWRLPIRYYALVNSADVEPELVHLFSLCQNFRCAIDIGANHGYYSYKMSRRFDQVYAFEANSRMEFDLQYFNRPNIHFFKYGLSDTAMNSVLFIPVHQGVQFVGWASLAERKLPFANSFTQIPIELQRLDDQPFVSDHTIDLIKIDVEGHELEVLKGAIETIRRDKPVLIIEKSIQQYDKIRYMLDQVGYRSTSFEQLTGKPLSSPNVIFLPK